MRKVLFLLGAVLLLTAGCTMKSRADAPPMLSPLRFAGGLTASAVMYHNQVDGARSGFAPDAWLSYSMTPNLSAAASVSDDFGRGLTQYKAGGRMQLYGNQPHDRLHAFLGVDYVRYDGEAASEFAERTSWQSSIRLAWSAVQDKNGRTSVYTVLQNEYDPENQENFLKLGLRLQVFGGANH